MSKICLITAQNVQMSPDSLRRRIVDLSAERNIGAFFPTASNVGLTEYEGAFVCSISDDFLTTAKGCSSQMTAGTMELAAAHCLRSV